MGYLDWSIVVLSLIVVTYSAFQTRKYTRSVADFLAANRCAGRYLLTISQGIAFSGAITIVANWEMFYKAGFTAAWWQLIWVVLVTVMSLSGWVVYRFRQTKALTMAQFLELRYSRKFRIFAGFLAWFSGIINFGIFPSVGARFVIYFCGFPDSIAVYAMVMAILLLFALSFTLFGGQVTVIVTDFVQGAFSNIFYIVILIALLLMFGWSRIISTLSTAPQAASLLHPFNTKDAQDFNIWFYLIVALTMFYVQGAWQGAQGYFASGRTPHESRMGNILSSWRILPMTLFMMLLPICAYTFMHHPDFAGTAQSAKVAIAGISSPQIQSQMTPTISMRFFIPPGIMGCLTAIMIAAFIGNHNTYMHSWGSIFIQDVVLPFRKKAFEPNQHLFYLRLSIIGVTVFIFLFSLLFRQTEYILMFFQITGAIFTGGAGAVIIGGLYWKRGNTPAAWSAMITGSTLALVGVVIRQINSGYPEFFTSVPYIGSKLAFIASKNGAVLGFYASVTAIIIYVCISLLGSGIPFNMDKMLHRGKYSIQVNEKDKVTEQKSSWKALVGIDSEFNMKDKIIYLLTIGWSGLLITTFITGTVYNFAFKVATESWVSFWKIYVIILLVVSIITTIWFTIGGFIDLKNLFATLNVMKRDHLDDGMVFDGRVEKKDENQLQVSGNYKV